MLIFRQGAPATEAMAKVSNGQSPNAGCASGSEGVAFSCIGNLLKSRIQILKYVQTLSHRAAAAPDATAPGILQGPPSLDPKIDGRRRQSRASLHDVLAAALATDAAVPAIVCSIDREDRTLLSTDKTESSHTIFAALIEWMAVMDNVKLNNERMMAQITLQKMFHAQLESVNLSGPIEDKYNFYCHHTRLYVNSSALIGQSLLFKPIDAITVGDKIYSIMLSYFKAQYHLFKDKKEELSIDDSISYADVLRKCAHCRPVEPGVEPTGGGGNAAERGLKLSLKMSPINRQSNQNPWSLLVAHSQYHQHTQIS